jgi:hypothetical protein
LRVAGSKDIKLPNRENLEAILTSDTRGEPVDDALVSALSQAELDEFVQYFASYAFSTSPYHLLKDEPERIDSLEGVVRALDRLDPTKVTSVGPRQEWLRALLSAGKYGPAQDVADALLGQRLDQDWRLTVTRDAVWLLIEQYRQPGVTPEVARQKLDLAFKWVEDGLLDPNRPERVRREYRPLLVERGRLRAVKGDWKNAAADLDDYLKDARLPDLPTLKGTDGPRFAPSQSVPALFFLEAFLLRGFLYEQAQDPAAARRCWEQGFRQVHGTAAVADYEAAMLGSLVNKLDHDDAARMVNDTKQRAGFLGSRLIDRLSTNKTSEFKLVTSVLQRAWQSERGHNLARQIALRDLSFHDALGIQIRLWVHEGFRQGVAGPSRRDRKLPDPQDKLLWDTAGQMLDDYRKGTLTEATLLTLIAIARGGPLSILPRESFVRNADWLKADWFGGLAYILGCHYENNLSDPAFAAKLFRRAADAAPADSVLRGLIEERTAGRGPKR